MADHRSPPTAPVAGMRSPPLPRHGRIDEVSREWLRTLRGAGAGADAARADLRALLVRSARFELCRRRAPRSVVDEMALDVADEALGNVCGRLDDFHGQASFTTWAAKFAVVGAAVRSRRNEWAARELPQPTTREALAKIGLDDEHDLATTAAALDALPSNERSVLIALAIEGVPIDVLAERAGTSRDALYTTLQRARHRLRAHLDA
jgi:RNA polymerase sigma-70 factor, ECF subfamily